MIAKDKSRKLKLRVSKVNNLTMIHVNKCINGNSPWLISEEISKTVNVTEVKKFPIRRFSKRWKS